MAKDLTLRAKIVLSGQIEILTGLAIGGAGGEMKIGGVDNTVIRDPMSNEPIIPGSSLKGKLRSLLERAYKGNEDDLKVIVARENIRIHMCDDEASYNECPVCPIFGLPPEDHPFVEPGRLIVRDARLAEGETKEKLRDAGDLPFTEIKTEVVLDRITAKANPREQERVPAGAIFNFEIVFNVLKEADGKLFRYVLEALRLLEDDYLGGKGTRGYGKVKFKGLTLQIRSRKYYETAELTVTIDKKWDASETIIQDFEAIIAPKIQSVCAE